MVVGQDKKFIGALIVPDEEGFREKGIKFESPEELARDPQANRLVREEIRTTISQVNGFKGFEHIHDFRLVPRPFEVGEELTNLFKLKRHVIEKKYAPLIEEMFQS
jgi:long-chain acyl-CoA synthetase